MWIWGNRGGYDRTAIPAVTMQARRSRPMSIAACADTRSGRWWRLSGWCMMATWLLAFATMVAAFRSAWYWYRSSQIYAVPDWVEVGREEPSDPLQLQLGWM